MKSLAPQPIGLINKQNLIKRTIKTLWLYSTTNYNIKLSWHQAGR